MYKKISFSVLLFICTLTSFAQSTGDLLRLSQTYPTGTARSMSMAGAFGALGADISVMSQNPAGLGVYQGDELTLTPMLSVHHTDALLDGQETGRTKTSFPFNNFGLVSTSQLGSQGLKSFTWGFAFNRMSEFRQNIAVTSDYGSSSILDEFAAAGNNFNGNGYNPVLPCYLSKYAGMAFDVYAIDTAYFFGANPSTGTFDTQPYFHDFMGVYGEYQHRDIRRRGDIREYDFSLGFNVNDEFYFGATLGFQDVYFKETITHYEWDDVTEYMRDFLMLDEFRADGFGVNLKLGAIYRPIPEMRLGLAIHTPTWYSLESEGYTYMSSSFYKSPSDDGDTFFETDKETYFEYDMRAPARFITSWAYVFQNIGLISIDYEFIDYSTSKMTAKGDKAYAREVTQTAKEQFASTGNLRIGAELRLSPVAYLRAGYANLGNPYNEPARNSDYCNQQIFSTGLGFRWSDVFLDLAYQRANFKEDIWMYDDNTGNGVCTATESGIDRFALTLGLHL